MTEASRNMGIFQKIEDVVAEHVVLPIHKRFPNSRIPLIYRPGGSKKVLEFIAQSEARDLWGADVKEEPKIKVKP